MICFQKLFFISLPTTQRGFTETKEMLWFAFKNCSLYLYQQHLWGLFKVKSCCDLLSKIVLYIFTNNFSKVFIWLVLVVICFQKLFFISLPTTTIAFGLFHTKLWFAFKNCSLYLYQQLLLFHQKQGLRCDLLSKIVLYIFTNNGTSAMYPLLFVVICFQKLFFISLPTT